MHDSLFSVAAALKLTVWSILAQNTTELDITIAMLLKYSDLFTLWVSFAGYKYKHNHVLHRTLDLDIYSIHIYI